MKNVQIFTTGLDLAQKHIRKLFYNYPLSVKTIQDQIVSESVKRNAGE